MRLFLQEGGVCIFMGNIIFTVIGILVGLAAGFVFGVIYRKKVAEKEIGSAELEATRLINEAIQTCTKGDFLSIY